MDNIENNPAPIIDRVIDGVQLWNLFTQSFQSPVRACFDLIDNVFDAAPSSNGRLAINIDSYEQEFRNRNGIYILSNCQHPVKPMREVLTCFNNGERDRSQIGENGIGLKQACACLSDISVVMSRNEHVYSLGILARSLQTPAGFYLPSFEFQFDPANNLDLYEFLMMEITTIVNSFENIAAVVQEFGHGNVARGVLRLVKNMMRMNGEENHVFCICAHGLIRGLTHGETNADFLLNVKNELPEHYFHVPQSFQVLVGSDPIHFNHWPSRLTRVTKYNVRIPKTVLLNGKNLNGAEDDHAVSVYLGFDTVRIAQDGQTPASLSLYSRKFGRLVKSLPDCRGSLRLCAGGTQYCQALTIIIDDISGALPLSLFKNDFAFGEHDHGLVWEQNLFKWVSAVTKVYYNYYLGNVCHERKSSLAEIVKNDRASQLGKIYEVDVSRFRWNYRNDSIKAADNRDLQEYPTPLHRVCSLDPRPDILGMIEESGIDAFNKMNIVGITPAQYLIENPNSVIISETDILRMYTFHMIGDLDE
ncbi:hypothetical protein CTEN210_12049 [Chaetoceros tenuissimus]|uniref:Uncharacterized protein n=1 Tax=Chaetoceros tenuissimus TaxID=426638 RepID=A0AAD3D0R7_9STRA|nr:hypothetical protein CTEN210_12049 [Chaetoceros tenuissimus]